MSIIYEITCIETGKFYIGSTMNKAQRWARHRRELRAGIHVNKHMQAAWAKYGEGAFEFKVLEEVQTPALLFAVEQRYLDKHVGTPLCFNWSKYAGAPMRGKYGADTPNFGKVLSEEAKQKLRIANSGIKHPNWGKTTSEVTKAKISEANKTNPWRGSKHTPESIAKIAAASTGRPVSEETRLKRSIALKGREISTAQRLQISRTLSGEGNFWYGKERSEEFKSQIRKAVVVTDSKGTETVYPSVQAVREALQLKPPTVNRALKSGTTLVRGPQAGLTFKYLAPTPAS
jgi:group I intron endonuclease